MKAVMKMMEKGMYSKAGRMLQSKGVADIEDEGVQQQLEAKHPTRQHALPGELPAEVRELRVGFDKAMMLEVQTQTMFISSYTQSINTCYIK